MNVVVLNTGMETDGMIFNSPQETVFSIPLPDLSRKDQPGMRISNLAMWEIPKRIADTKVEISDLRRTMAATAAFGMVTGDLPALSGKAWKSNVHYLGDLRSRLARLHAEPHRRWANAFSCLAFVFVGAPVAISIDKQGVRLGRHDIRGRRALRFFHMRRNALGCLGRHSKRQRVRA